MTGTSPGPGNRNPAATLTGCRRILVLGRTGSGKTTLARSLAAALDCPHVELDSLYFEPGINTVPLEVLRQRTAQAVAGDRWVTDGNKRAVRDIVWPRADTIIWLDYPLAVSLVRLGKRAARRTSGITRGPGAAEGNGSRVKQLGRAAKGVATALRSHRGQRREYPALFRLPPNRHLAVLRLRSPAATSRWLAKVTGSGPPATAG